MVASFRKEQNDGVFRGFSGRRLWFPTKAYSISLPGTSATTYRYLWIRAPRHIPV
jgi:hypothetical protein